MMAVLDIWLLAIACSVVWTAIDVMRHRNRAMPIMNVVWPLMALYFGPLGTLLYVTLSGRTVEGHVSPQPLLPPTPPSHGHGTQAHAATASFDVSTMGDMNGQNDARHMGSMAGHAMGPLWRRALRSSTHCMAGCALGDLVAMFLVGGIGLFGGTMAAEAVTGAVLAFALGLFVFQALPIMAERKIGFAAALSTALRADAITISAYLVGQIAALYVLARLFPGAMGLTVPAFVTMQAAMAAGFLTTYPANYGVVVTGIKAGM